MEECERGASLSVVSCRWLTSGDDGPGRLFFTHSACLYTGPDCVCVSLCVRVCVCVYGTVGKALCYHLLAPWLNALMMGLMPDHLHRSNVWLCVGGVMCGVCVCWWV